MRLVKDVRHWWLRRPTWTAGEIAIQPTDSGVVRAPRIDARNDVCDFENEDEDTVEGIFQGPVEFDCNCGICNALSEDYVVLAADADLTGLFSRNSRATMTLPTPIVLSCANIARRFRPPKVLVATRTKIWSARFLVLLLSSATMECARTFCAAVDW